MVWPKKVRQVILSRAGGRCEGCGAPIPDDADIHHRQYVSRGGKSTVGNGIALCGKGNVRAFGCHGRAHSREGHELGWSVHSWQNPADVPIVRWDGALVHLTDDGQAQPIGEQI